MNVRSRLSGAVRRVPGVGPIAAMMVDPIGAMRNPETFKLTLQQAMDRAWSLTAPLARRIPTSVYRTLGRRVLRALRGKILAGPADPLDEIRGGVESDPRSDTVRRLFRDAFSVSPRLAFEIALEAQRSDRIMRSLSFVARFRDVLEQEVPEALHESAMSLLARSEPILRDHAEWMTKLLNAVSGTPPPSDVGSTTFGTVVRYVREHAHLPTYAGIFDVEVSHLRNAACHGRDRYAAASESVEWRDANTPPQTAPLADFIEKVCDALMLAGPVFEQGARDFMMQDAMPFPPIRDKQRLAEFIQIGEMWLSDHATERAQAERAASVLFDSMTNSFAALFVPGAPTRTDEVVA